MGNKSLIIPGFRFAGIPAGIKGGRKKDLALIYSEVPAVTVGALTAHPAAAAPVRLTKQRLRSSIAQAVVINSGNANACTGKRGDADARAMCKRVAHSLDIPLGRTLVCSTGVIGVPLPIRSILKGIDQAADRLKPTGLKAAAEAILTTDQDVKVAALPIKWGRQLGRVVGFAKGAGMIEPHMQVARGKPHATMLAFIMTDLAVEPRWARRTLSELLETSFNAISVDGDTSTNDTCLLLANGVAGNPVIGSKSAGARPFEQALAQVMKELAYAMVADGEGASKVVRIIISEAKSPREARQAAYAIANSQLVRTAFHGGDPNWGRVMAALGSSGATCTPNRVDISYGGVTVCRRGLDAGPAAEQKAKRAIRGPEFTLQVKCRAGRASHQILSSDLSPEYVKLNSHYRS